MSDSPSQPTEPKKYTPRTSIRRPTSNSSRRHAAAKTAVDRIPEEVARWSPLKVVLHFAKARWGDERKVVCCHCNTSAEHYFSRKELRWKCKSCGKRFSVTSNTLLAGHRISLLRILGAIHCFVSASAGRNALELRRARGFRGINTAFVFAGKLREAALRGRNTGLISGTVEIDGAHASGFGASENKGLPLRMRNRKTDAPVALDSTKLTSSARAKARNEEKRENAAKGTPETSVRSNVPESRRVYLNARLRGTSDGRGAQATLVCVTPAERTDVIKAFVDKHVCISESILATDQGKAFLIIGPEFQAHSQVNHSDTFKGPGGEHNNNSESFASRQDRAEKGTYVNIEPKYLADYLAMTAFLEDHQLPPGAQADCLLHYVLNVGPSQWWCNYTHGKHRDHEISILGNRPAKPGGPAKGRNPIPGANGVWPK